MDSQRIQTKNRKERPKWRTSEILWISPFSGLIVGEKTWVHLPFFRSDLREKTGYLFKRQILNNGWLVAWTAIQRFLGIMLEVTQFFTIALTRNFEDSIGTEDQHSMNKINTKKINIKKED
ncbi:uncharacterized protein [Euphorbia lathyris]|uniref:uncharacterized protein n=1 Tax=Euphorbia lathyris TaxID=212925 RepID=UPI003313E3A9